MDKKLLATTFAGVVLGLGISNFAISDMPANFKVATVDVQKVVGSSVEVQKLKADHQKEITNLTSFVNEAKANLTKETDVTKRKKLEEKYNKQLNDKKAALEKKYTQKLTAIDKSITNLINREAKAQGFDIVLTKGVVLYGGTDITNVIEKAVK